MFQFRLAKVLNHRRRIVDDEARCLQTLAAALNGLQARKHAFTADIEVAGEAALRSRRDTVDIDLERAAADFVAGRRRQIELVELQIAEQQTIVERQRLVLVTAQQEVTVLEQLEQRQRDEWEQQDRRQQQKQIDEVAARRFSTLTPA